VRYQLRQCPDRVAYDVRTTNHDTGRRPVAQTEARLEVLRGVAPSGGFSQAEAGGRSVRDPGPIPGFSRALPVALTAQRSDAEVETAPAEPIETICRASMKAASMKDMQRR